MIKARIAKQSDILAISEIELRAFPNDPWSQAALRSELDYPESIVVVVENSDKVLGYAALRKIFEEGHITTVAIDIDVRRQGLGTKLINELLGQAVDMGVETFTLEVREGNVSAIKLYEKFGFLVEGKRKNYYNFPKEDGIIMWKK